MEKVVFMTGATGLIGGSVLARILKGDSETQLVLLIRGDSEEATEHKLVNAFRILSPDINFACVADRIKIVKGDITLPRLGLSGGEFRSLAKKVTHILHAAALIRFNLPIEDIRPANVRGTTNVMEFAQIGQRSGRLRRIGYVSTAYVSGTRSGTLYENEFDCSQRFFNSYEQSKFEGEEVVRAFMSELPITVFRPGIVVGDSNTGRTTSFKVLYFPLKLIYRGLLRCIPGSPSTPLDVVPVDFVSDAIYHILFKSDQGIGQTYHLTGGRMTSSAASEIVDLAVDFFNSTGLNESLSRIRFVPLDVFRSIMRTLEDQTRAALKMMEYFVPYLAVPRNYDNSNANAALVGTGIRPRGFPCFYRNLLNYCLKTDWGKRRYSAI